MQLLELADDRVEQVRVQPGSAKQFLEMPNLAESLVQLIPAK